MNPNIIPINQAIEMKNEYEKNIAPLIENSKSDTTYQYYATEFAFIDFKTLKDYVKLLEEVENNNDKSVSGIRIYFSSYPNNVMNSTRTTPQYKGRETLFIAPTIKAEPKSELSFEYPNLTNLPFCIEPIENNPLRGKFEIIGNLLSALDEKPANTTYDVVGKTSLIMNEFSLTPPPK